MAENRGFGKGSRNEGYKPAARGGKTFGSRKANSGSSARGADFGAARRENVDSTSDLRSGRSGYGQSSRSPSDIRGGRPRYAQNNSRTPDARGPRSRTQETILKGSPAEEHSPGFQENEDMLEGRNSVLEALKAGRSINRIFVAKGDREGSVNQIIAMARESKILIQEIERAKLDEMSQTYSHQGVIALAAAKNYVEVDEILAKAAESGKPPFIIVLDEITDSYNLGSILRTANAAGAHGVIIPKRRAIGLTPAVSKASAGAIEYVPVARVTNIVQTIEMLKKKNIWVVGTDLSGDKPYYERDLTGPIALVIGSEGEGMGKLVRESCDFVVSIPMLGQISSLNAAVAGAIVTYEILRQRNS